MQTSSQNEIGELKPLHGLRIRLTSSPQLNFETETFTYSITINHHQPNHVKDLHKEAIQMLYHHYGVKEANKTIKQWQQFFSDFYKKKNP